MVSDPGAPRGMLAHVVDVHAPDHVYDQNRGRYGCQEERGGSGVG